VNAVRRKIIPSVDASVSPADLDIDRLLLRSTAETDHRLMGREIALVGEQSLLGDDDALGSVRSNQPDDRTDRGA